MPNIYDRLSPENLIDNPARKEIGKLMQNYTRVNKEMNSVYKDLVGSRDAGAQALKKKLLRADKQIQKQLQELVASTENFAKIAPAKSHLKGQALANRYIKKQSKYEDVNGNIVQVLQMQPKDTAEIKEIVDQIRTESLREVRLITGDWRDRFDKTIRQGILDLRGGTTVEIRKKIADRIRKEGFNLIDRAGRSWSPEKYAKMYARTRTREYQTAGIEYRMEDYDLDLVQISQHLDVDGQDICNEFEGNVYSLSGNHPDYSKLTVHTPFHPNCVHVETPWIEKYQNPEKFNEPPKKEFTERKIKDPQFKSKNNWEADLSTGEKEAIRKYTDDNYKTMRAWQKGTLEGEYTEQVERDTWNMANALRRAPGFEGKSYRGMKNIPDDVFNAMLNEDKISFDTFQSTSQKLKKAKGFATPTGSREGRSVILEIEGRTGIDIQDISEYHEEQEVVFLNGAEFMNKGKVDEVELPVGGKAAVIKLIEITR